MKERQGGQERRGRGEEVGRDNGNPNVDYGEAHDSMVGSCNFL